MNYTELMNLIQEERYASLDLPTQTKFPEFEGINNYGDVTTLWDELKEELGRIPTQKEYGKEALARAEYFFNTFTNSDGSKTIYTRPYNQPGHPYKFRWSRRLARSVLIREMRCYQSYLVEDVLVSWLLEHKGHEIRVGVHENMDKVMGVDLAVHFKEYDYIMYVHVTTKSQMFNLGGKEKRNQKNANGYFERDFTNHVVLGYERVETEVTDKVNGLYIPNQYKLELFYNDMRIKAGKLSEKSKKDSSLQESLESNSLHELEDWLSGGLWSNTEPLTLKGLWQEPSKQLI